MHRLFLDANVLFSAAWSLTALMRRLWFLDAARVTLVTSDVAINEARRNLPSSKQADLDDLLEDVDEVPTPPLDNWLSPPSVRLPDKDLPILQAAIAAKATHLLTGDKTHFGPYFGQVIEGVLILPPASYPANS